MKRLHHYEAEPQRAWNIFKQALPYAYNNQVNCSTLTDPFSSLLLRHPPGPTTFLRSSALPTDANNETAPAVLPSKLLHCIDAMGQKTNRKLAGAQHRYQENHDLRICVTDTFRPAQWVYIDCTPLAVTAAYLPLTYGYSKLLSGKLGPYRIISSTTETVTIHEEGLLNTISPYRPCLVLQSETGSSSNGAGARHQSECPVGLPGPHSTTAWPIDTSDP